MNGLLDVENKRTLWHRVSCGQVLVQFLDIASRETIMDPGAAMAGMLGVVSPDADQNIIHPMFENALKRLNTFIPKLCHLICNKDDNGLKPIQLSCGELTNPFGQVRLNCLELLTVSADFAQLECGEVLGLVEVKFWEEFLNMAFIYKENNMYLCHFRRLIHLSMIFRRRLLKHLFLNCKMLKRFVEFYDEHVQKTALHGYILQMLWDIYNHDKRDDLKDVEVDGEDDLFQPNFSDDPEDKWDIVSFFDGSDVWKKFNETVSSEMEARNSKDEQDEDQQQQLDELLQNLLGSNNDTSNSTDSDLEDED